MSDLVPIEPPSAGETIDELYVWMAVTDGGGEGLVGLPGISPIGPPPFLLIAGSPHAADHLKPTASKIIDGMNRRGGNVTLALRKFIAVPFQEGE